MWHRITDSIMKTTTSVMGETVEISFGGAPFEEVRAIYEERTNFDETDSDANIENFVAVADFRSSTLSMNPRRNDLVMVPRIGKTYKIVYVEFDGWSRHRCYLKDGS